MDAVQEALPRSLCLEVLAFVPFSQAATMAVGQAATHQEIFDFYRMWKGASAALPPLQVQPANQVRAWGQVTAAVQFTSTPSGAINPALLIRS